MARRLPEPVTPGCQRWPAPVGVTRPGLGRGRHDDNGDDGMVPLRCQRRRQRCPQPSLPKELREPGRDVRAGEHRLVLRESAGPLRNVLSRLRRGEPTGARCRRPNPERDGEPGWMGSGVEREPRGGRDGAARGPRVRRILRHVDGHAGRQGELADRLPHVVRGDGVLRVGRRLSANGGRVDVRGERRRTTAATTGRRRRASPAA